MHNQFSLDYFDCSRSSPASDLCFCDSSEVMIFAAGVDFGRCNFSEELLYDLFNCVEVNRHCCSNSII